MSDSELIRKALNIISESVVEDDEKSKRPKHDNESHKDHKETESKTEESEKDSEDKPKGEFKQRNEFKPKSDSAPTRNSNEVKHKNDDESPKSVSTQFKPKGDAEDSNDSKQKSESTPKADSAPKKESAPKKASTPSANIPSVSNTDWAKHGFPGMGEGIYEGELDEGVNITLDGKEADDFVARLMQLSGQQTTPVQSTQPLGQEAVPVGMDGPPVMGMDEPAGIPIDQPETDADHYVCDSCYCDPCECESTDMFAVEETADYDNVNADATDNIEEVDDDSYIWKPIVTPQRMVKGTMGDNPMIQRESIERFNKILNDYNRFLNESSNDDGLASPFTGSNRQEFDKDPNINKKPKDDGSMSPMSQIKRQKVMK